MRIYIVMFVVNLKKKKKKSWWEEMEVQELDVAIN